MAFNQLNYYQILGISVKATQEEIKKAYKNQAKKYHPDINHDVDATEMMQRINEAYETLSDLAKRKEYDKIIVNAKVDEVYNSYTTPREDSEDDLDEWLKKYLNWRRRLSQLYNLYAKKTERLIFLDKQFIKPLEKDVIESQLIIELIKKELYSIDIFDEKNIIVILEHLFIDIEKPLNKTYARKANNINDVFKDEIIMNLLLAEIKFFLDKYTDENNEYYNIVMEYITVKYFIISSYNGQCRAISSYISPFNLFVEDLLKNVLEGRKEFVKQYLKEKLKK